MEIPERDRIHIADVNQARRCGEGGVIFEAFGAWL